MLSDLAVRRPVFAAVAAIVLCVIGAAAFFFLPVRELPDVDPPIVSVSTSYAGASAEVIESRITEPIEQQIAGIQGVERISSSSRDGRSNVSIEFSLDRNIDDAANDVRDRVSRVVGRLPDQAQPPEVSKADSDSQPIMILFLRSTSMNRLELTDYADRYLIDRLATVPGVAQVQIYGEQRYAMRIWLDAAALAARGLTVTDVESALTAQNVELPAGQLESGQKDYTVRVARTYARAEDFRQLPIGTRGSGGVVAAQTGSATALPSGASGAIQGQSGYVTRLGDIARIVEAPAEDRRLFRGNGQDQIGLAVTRQAQSNDLAISKGVEAMLDDVRASLPEGTELVIGSDNSVFTSHAIDEVWITIGISLALVALVNFIFLGSLRAAFIPSIVAPICLLATFIVLAPLGFSLNLLTLLALVLAIGLVVDDAIVVTENIQRRLDHGEPPLVAAERGARQVFFAVVATTVVLLAVFAPLLFLPGYVGRLFVELAAAIAAAVAFSAFLALTLSPMLASRILRPAKTGGWVARKVDRAMEALRNSYQNSLQALLGKRVAVAGMVGLIVAVAAGAAFMFVTLPNELVPAEDRGRVQIRVQGPEGAGFDYTRNIMMGIEPILAEYKASGEASSFLISAPGFGGGSYNSGNGSLILSDWSERDRAADEIAQELNGKLRGQTDAQVNASVPGAFQRGGGNSNSIEMVVTGAEYEDIYKWLQPVLAASLENPGFSRPRLNYEPNAPRLLVDVDPEKAAALGVSSQAIGRTLETMFGSRRATTYLRGGQEYDVILQTERADRRSVADLEALYVATGSGQLVPLSAVVTTQTSGDTPDRRRLDRQRAISISADLNPGTTLVDATEFMTRVSQEQPQGIVTTQWGGAARDQQEAGGAVAAAFGLALLLVFLVLAAQFESWITPAVIMLTVPLAAAGGLFGLVMAGSSLNIYSQIGLIILIGVAAKNGILIVEFANQLRDQGRSIQEAIIESSTLRLRPIIMTSIATAFGALPLVLWQGAGAGSRQTIGVVIFAGAMFATLLTLFVVPVIYGALARFTKSPEYTARKIEEWEARETTANDTVPAAAE
ncbi:MAG: efflux RND transporter permease subunit [Brevundimonas sp.]|uniref:efflux RND transporter permease subunit n=1 Tax=Brevundimonas sp. TaxID=1871086 RepID=UPI002721B8D0|nr:efflux RND transporter permease subunit [Brevundimonas sp.]MDO9077871.1 efflux RND transporter permease subunit [Brevundimonas sp.]MDP3080646.1 efflux RND transporter permease subunit [Brevundimonas sp.]MDZ4063025.1 efflux RND transporter permease subunit [Brevundimonas sp.]